MEDGVRESGRVPQWEELTGDYNLKEAQVKVRKKGGYRYERGFR